MTAPTEASLLCFLLGCEEGTFCWRWITSLSDGVKVKRTQSGGVLHWTHMDHLKWNQFSWRIRAGCHNVFYLTTINTCIDLPLGSNLERSESGEKRLHSCNTSVQRRVTSVNPSWFSSYRVSRCGETRVLKCLPVLNPAASLHVCVWAPHTCTCSQFGCLPLCAANHPPAI